MIKNMPREPMPKPTPENKEETIQSSPWERFVDLLKEETPKRIYILEKAFSAGKKNKREDLVQLTTAASQAGDLELLGKIKKAFRAGEEVGPTKTKDDSRKHDPTPPEGPEGKTIKFLDGVRKTLEGIKGLSKEEIGAMAKIMMELAPELDEKIQEGERIEVRVVVAKFIDRFLEKIDTLPETMFKELRTVKKEQPDEFERFRIALEGALLTDNKNERDRKVADIYRDYEITGDTLEEIKKLMTVADTLRETVEGKTLTPEEKKKAEEMQKAGLAAAGGLWEKIWPIGGLFLSLMLIGLILTVILVLSVSDSKFGKGK